MTRSEVLLITVWIPVLGTWTQRLVGDLILVNTRLFVQVSVREHFGRADRPKIAQRLVERASQTELRIIRWQFWFLAEIELGHEIHQSISFALAQIDSGVHKVPQRFDVGLLREGRLRHFIVERELPECPGVQSFVHEVSYEKTDVLNTIISVCQLLEGRSVEESVLRSVNWLEGQPESVSVQVDDLLVGVQRHQLFQWHSLQAGQTRAFRSFQDQLVLF